MVTKSMPAACFKQEPEVSNLKQFIILLETINLEDKKGHIFVVDI